MKLLLILLTLLIGTTAYADDDDVIRTDNNSTVTSNGSMDTTIYSPPPSAISPNLTTGTGDLCTISASASIQTQILGLSAGKVFTEKNCVRLKNAKTLFDMGLKVAAISVMCEEESGVIRKSLKNAGTPCPHKGLIGDAALIAYELDNKEANKEKKSNGTLRKLFNSENDTKIGIGTVFSSLLFLLAL